MRRYAQSGCRPWRLIVAVAVLAPVAHALEISNYYSPRNASRPLRRETHYIVLHTTEGAAKGSLRKIRERGEAHYVVDTRGHTYRVIHRDRIATHAGRSMWAGRRNIDQVSVAIEVVGYHDRSITAAQYRAVREVLADLQRLYRIPDERVLCHAMVAYGAPNRWHPHSHRGRKRCGMQFAFPGVRRQLGLEAKPARDPDVAAGRLVVADSYLERMLFRHVDRHAALVATAQPEGATGGATTISATRTAWDIARDRYNSHDTTYVFPNGTRRRGDQVSDWTKMPLGTRVIVSDGRAPETFEGFRKVTRARTSARDFAGSEYASRTTVYFFPNGRVRRGDQLDEETLLALPAGTRALVGYSYGGRITARRSAFKICGERWNYPSTFYRFPDGTIRTGDAIKEGAIPRNAQVFFRN